MPPGFNLDYINQFEPCECCKPKYGMTTSTFVCHKWSKEEIENTLLELAKDLATCSWFDKGNIISNIKHWSAKLDRLNQAKDEFNL